MLLAAVNLNEEASSYAEFGVLRSPLARTLFCSQVGSASSLRQSRLYDRVYYMYATRKHFVPLPQTNLSCGVERLSRRAAIRVAD